MIRIIIKIDKDKCNGCGACASACHEGAIEMINGIAALTREDYCDGLGDCLPTCPVGAISFIEKEAPAYNEEAVRQAMQKKKVSAPSFNTLSVSPTAIKMNYSKLMQWPCQIKLAPVNAPYFEDCNLLIAADCTAYAYANFHNEFMQNRITLIGCPKLDSIDYSEKITQIIASNNTKSIKIVKMEVPCCSSLEFAVKKAILKSGKDIPCTTVTITTNGQIINK